MTARECRVELLIGRRVVDANDEVVGRLEEIVADYVDDEYVVREFHVGAYAALERLGTGMLGRGLLRLIGGGRIYTGYIVPWRQMDLSDPVHPHVTVAKGELPRIGETPDDTSRTRPTPSKRSRRSA
jgi:sporulation protein YlmC with PRC-barrel domain